MWTLLFASAVLARPLVGIDGTRTETGVHWTAVVYGAEGPVMLVEPVETDVRASPGVQPIRDAEGRVVGFASGSSAFTLEVDEVLQSGQVVLHPPLLEGVLGRVVLEKARFEPDDGLGLDLKLGRWETPDVDRADRRGLERVLGRDRGAALWIGPTGLAGPLAGELTPPGARPTTVLGVAVIFAGVLAGLVLGARALDGSVRRERNDVYIRTELRKPNVMPD